MGRPLNKHLFGDNANNNIKVQFHNGDQSTRGFIVRQRSNLKFLCQDEFGVQKVCKLVVKDSADLQPGEMSITVKYDDNTVRHVVKIAKNLITVAYSGTNPVTGGTHGSSINGQAGWSFSTSTSDKKWQIEEAGTNPTMANATDLEGDDFVGDRDYPVPGSGTYRASEDITATYSAWGTPAAATGGVTTVSNSASGLYRTKWVGQMLGAVGSGPSGWDMTFPTGYKKVGTVVDTDVSFGGQIDVAPNTHFSLEWTGYIKVPTTQAYNFVFDVDDDVAVWVGSAAVTPTTGNYLSWASNKTQDISGHATNGVTLDSTKWYPIRIRFSENDGNCNMQVFAIGEDGTTLLNGADLQWAYNTSTNGF